ncbi:MAG: hypothetical protein ABII93_09090 [Chrysiogenia bacterium]
MTPDNKEIVLNSLRGLTGYLERCNFAGWEYDDLLASPLVRLLTFKLLPLQIAAVQVAKRSFVNPRRILGVPKLKSTKANGFMVKGFLRALQATGDDKWLKHVRELLAWLLENASPGYSGCCWGNDFDFASRAGFFPKGLPTVVWSSHIQDAFFLAYEVLGDEAYKKNAISVADFVATDLPRLSDESGICLAYAPSIVAPVHNANLLGAAALLRAWKYSGKAEHYDLAKKAINWSVKRINNDGSWFYGDKPMLHWIDNYHTAYNLDCLSLAHEAGGESMVAKDVLQRTFEFWRDHFIGIDGRPNFYHDRVYPIDIQATAQAIESMAKYSTHDENALDLAWKIALWAIRNMQKNNGAFRYRIRKYWTNNLEAIHWGQATMLSALGHLLFHSERSINDGR